MPRARTSEGWHAVQLNGGVGAVGVKASGLYLVRLSADGGYRYVKPVALMR
jgi:hypothetical protein